ncbi:MAG: hypothetical protein DRP87_03155 [Spirochaetes bacterium]|nr:MAG: hypothetical protein DRP87_03155 [Spirochaetota bacterium]
MKKDKLKARNDREKNTFYAMMSIYCSSHHGRGKGLCSECKSLLSYIYIKIDLCVFKNKKPKCIKCALNCFNREMRSKMEEVIKFSQYRLIFKHPLLAASYFLEIAMQPVRKINF